MFIIVPLILIAVSCAGMIIIVYRKLPYLRKLSPESHQVSENLFDDFFPELMHWINNIPWHQYEQNILRETEKLLRRLRLVVLKIDHASESLIKRIRRSHAAAQIEHQTAVQAEKLPDIVAESVAPKKDPIEELKAREQQLIIDISQNPKNPELYETLGDLYVKMDNIQDAKEAYEAALSFNPDNQNIARKYSALLKRTA